jgi:outer membrane protein OmpA-like peptidoglycan-associated protein
MRPFATRTFRTTLPILVSLLAAPQVALAQPADDPGFSEPAPPPKPAPAPTPKPAPAPTPPPGRTSTSLAPTTYAPPPEVHETVETQVTYTDADKDKGPAPADTELYDRAAGPTVFGPVGLFRTITGDSGKTNTFRIGLHVGGFTQDSFLIAGNGTLKGDSDARFQGDLTISYTPWKYIEAYLAIFNTSNQNKRTDTGRTDPEVILSLGDLALGLKGRIPISFVDLALHVGLRFLNGVSGISFNGSSTNFAVDAIASFDLRRNASTRNVPLRFHLNLGYLLDNSINLLPAGQCGLSTGNDPCIRSRVVETFAYGIGSSRMRFTLAADAPILLPRNVGLEPFFEYHLEGSVGDGDITIHNALKNDRTIPSDRLNGNTQQYLTFGVRIRPVGGLILDTGLDVGLQSPGFVYGPPVPQWNIIFGAAYAYGGSSPAGRNKVVTKTVTREIARGPVVGKIRGIVRDASTKRPLANAIVRYTNRRETPQVTGEDGTFVSYPFTTGPVNIEVTREDYNPAKLDTNAYANGETPVEIFLTAKPPSAGSLKARVSDDKGGPVAATVRFTSPNGSIVDADTDGPGRFVARLPQGDYTMDVVANGFLAKQQPVLVNSGQVTNVDVTLTKKPLVPRVVLGKTEIVVKGVVHFGTNDAVLKLDGEQLLDEVADVIIRNPQVKRIRIEGHTDNRGIPEKNMALSQARAASVKGYLIKVGVDPNRLEAEGYGANQPLVPNLTPANRARNRRVAFKILEQTGGGIPLE